MRRQVCNTHGAITKYVDECVNNVGIFDNIVIKYVNIRCKRFRREMKTSTQTGFLSVY